jgi:hypothetical protein
MATKSSLTHSSERVFSKTPLEIFPGLDWNREIPPPFNLEELSADE